MKKLISLGLVLILLVGLLVPASAAGTPTISISSGEVKAGESVTLTVSIKDNPGLAACVIYVYYDTDAFTVNPSRGISGSGSFRSSGGVIGNSIEVAKSNGRYNGLPGKDGVLALWYNGQGINTVGDGSMLCITLQAVENIANGDYTISLGYSPADTCDETGKNVVLSTVSGTVTVSGGVETEEKPETDENQTQESTVVFTDTSGHWAETFINQAAQMGLIEGYLGLYRPNDTMTRAECVTILWRAMGEPKPARKASFNDLDPNQKWYHDAVAWAEENNVVNGMGGGKFEPQGSVTREQLVTILHRLAGTPSGMEMMMTGVYDSSFTDSGKIGAWAKNALYWSVYNGIYCGENAVNIGSILAPNKPANRAQIAVMMVRYLQQ